jgi:hypothetical protein
MYMCVKDCDREIRLSYIRYEILMNTCMYVCIHPYICTYACDKDDQTYHFSNYDIQYLNSRKTITNQKTFLIKTTGTFLVEQSYKELALPTMTCPVTNKSFKKSDVIELVSAASAFAASGNVVAKVHGPTMN